MSVNKYEEIPKNWPYYEPLELWFTGTDYSTQEGHPAIIFKSNNYELDDYIYLDDYIHLEVNEKNLEFFQENRYFYLKDWKIYKKIECLYNLKGEVYKVKFNIKEYLDDPITHKDFITPDIVSNIDKILNNSIPARIKTITNNLTQNYSNLTNMKNNPTSSSYPSSSSTSSSYPSSSSTSSSYPFSSSPSSSSTSSSFDCLQYEKEIEKLDEKLWKFCTADITRNIFFRQMSFKRFIKTVKFLLDRYPLSSTDDFQLIKRFNTNFEIFIIRNHPIVGPKIYNNIDRTYIYNFERLINEDAIEIYNKLLETKKPGDDRKLNPNRDLSIEIKEKIKKSIDESIKNKKKIENLRLKKNEALDEISRQIEESKKFKQPKDIENFKKNKLDKLEIEKKETEEKLHNTSKEIEEIEEIEESRTKQLNQLKIKKEETLQILYNIIKELKELEEYTSTTKLNKLKTKKENIIEKLDKIYSDIGKLEALKELESFEELKTNILNILRTEKEELEEDIQKIDKKIKKIDSFIKGNY